VLARPRADGAVAHHSECARSTPAGAQPLLALGGLTLEAASARIHLLLMQPFLLHSIHAAESTAAAAVDSPATVASARNLSLCVR